MEQPRERAPNSKVKALVASCEALSTDLGVCNPEDGSRDPSG